MTKETTEYFTGEYQELSANDELAPILKPGIYRITSTGKFIRTVEKTRAMDFPYSPEPE
jgi:hypothetical protein